MDKEAQVAAQVAKNIPNAGPDKPAPIVNEVLKSSAETLVKPNSYSNDVAALRLMDHFEVPMHERKDRAMLDKLNYLYAWAGDKSKSDDNVDYSAMVFIPSFAITFWSQGSELKQLKKAVKTYNKNAGYGEVIQ